jgi:hypothetical protein
MPDIPALARYVTVGRAAVEVTADGPAVTGTCGGCGGLKTARLRSGPPPGAWDGLVATLTLWAQAHAEACRIALMPGGV